MPSSLYSKCSSRHYPHCFMPFTANFLRKLSHIFFPIYFIPTSISTKLFKTPIVSHDILPRPMVTSLFSYDLCSFLLDYHLLFSHRIQDTSFLWFSSLTALSEVSVSPPSAQLLCSVPSSLYVHSFRIASYNSIHLWMIPRLQSLRLNFIKFVKFDKAKMVLDCSSVSPEITLASGY